MYDREIARNLQAARSDTPVVLLSGPRQVGKSTLARRAAETGLGQEIRLREGGKTAALPSRYITLDDATTLASAAVDPEGWLGRYRSDDWTVIDEVQRLPDLLVAIKRDVDLDRRPNRYLLTGSANVLTIPRVAESLAGRIELLQMWPLSQAEIEAVHPTFLRRLFADDAPDWQGIDARDEIVRRALHGGYPDAIRRVDRRRRSAWFASYVTTVVQREIRGISNIENDSAIIRILRALASRSGQPKNIARLSIDTGVPASTLTRYVELLEATFIVHQLPSWSGGVDARIVRSPKILITDSGLYGYLLNLTSNDQHVGFLMENFVGTELLKLISYKGLGEYTLLHFRTRDQQEVDFAVELPDRRVVGIEVKAATTVRAEDFKGLHALSQVAGNRFHRGIVLYSGSQCVPFGRSMWAVPLGALWQ